MDQEQLVDEQYGSASLAARVEVAEPRSAGLADRAIGWVGPGAARSVPRSRLGKPPRELAEMLGIEQATLLDIGCGLAGPARFLAATYGCRVTGIDLSRPFVEAAELLMSAAE